MEYLHASWDDTTKTVTYTKMTANAYPFNLNVPNLVTQNRKETWYYVSHGTHSCNTTIRAYIQGSGTGTVNLILCDGAELTANKGIRVGEGITLHIYAQSAGDRMGKLVATGDPDGIAHNGGIGGIDNSGATLEIHGGVIEATGGGSGAPGINNEPLIAPSGVTTKGTVIIHGGVVTATGSDRPDMSWGGAGIGVRGSNLADGDGNVIIYGGTVTATGGNGKLGPAAGIGGGIGNPRYNTLTIGPGVRLYGGDSANHNGLLPPDDEGKIYDREPYMRAESFVPVRSVTLSDIELTVDETKTLTAILSPDKATSRDVVWSSDKPAVATVDESGNVTGVGVGTATITATATNGMKAAFYHVSASCTVKVSGGSSTEGNPTSRKGKPHTLPFNLEAVESLIRAFFKGWSGDIFMFPFKSDQAEVSGDRTMGDLPPDQLAELSSDHSVIVVVLPEIKAKKTAVFVLGLSLDVTPEGALKWNGYRTPAENSVALAAGEGSEECLFLNDDGQETKTAPTNGHVNLAVKLTAGNTYAPVITAETGGGDDPDDPDTPTGPTSNKGSGGCDAGLGGAALLALTARLLSLRGAKASRRIVPCGYSAGRAACALWVCRSEA